MPGAEPSTSPKPEIRIGSYRLLHPLGTGGMSSVYRAVHVDSGLDVAIKILPRNLARNSTMLQRFQREARNAETLQHPNIAAIFDRGSDQGRHYIVLEFVEGGDLHEAVRDRGPMGPESVVRIARDVAVALRYASQHGVIHRDIKPANLLFTKDGRVKVTDLGLALQLEADDERVTRDGTTVGTVDYMAPEQARDSRAASIRSDIYSLGCTLHYLLAGRPPFPGGDVAEKLSRHCEEPPPDIREARPDVPEGLARLIRTMLAKRPEDRFATYDALIEALDRLDGPSNGDGLTHDYALVDEEPEVEEDGWIPLGQPAADSTKEGEPVVLPPNGEPWSVSMADLAALDAGSDEAPTRPRRPLRESSSLEAPLGRFVREASGPKPGPIPQPVAGDELPVQAWIGIGLGVGLALAMIMAGVWYVLDPGVPAPVAVAEAAPEPEPVVREVAPRIPVVAPPPPAPEPPRPPEWVEPAETPDAVVAEVSYPPELEARLLPPWAREGNAGRDSDTRAIVSRVRLDPLRRSYTSLKRALDAELDGMLEIADNGPFFEDDLRITGRSRTIRAARGFRPVIRIEARRSNSLIPQRAVCVLEGRELVLEGLDLVLDLGERPLEEQSLFSCLGSNLVLRDCTITVLKAPQRGFSVIDLPDARAADDASRVWVERSLIRGSGVSLLSWGTAPAHVFVDRSVAIIGDAPAIRLTDGSTGGVRRLYLARSLLASGGSMLDLPAKRSSDGLEIRALGNTFARWDLGRPAPFLSLGEVTATPRWSGEANRFDGWSALVGRDGSKEVLIADLEAARSAWPGSETRSESKSSPWPPSEPSAGLEGLRSLAPERLATLSGVARPSPYLMNLANEPFEIPRFPSLPAALSTRVFPDDGSQGALRAHLLNRGLVEASREIDSGQILPEPGTPAPSGTPASAERLELFFDAQAAPYHGDLGRFIAAQYRTGIKAISVRARGMGPRATSPILLPEGVSLQIQVLPPDRREDEPLAWTHYVDAPDSPALIQILKADLVLVNVRLSRDGSRRPTQLVRVVDGNLIMNGCHLAGPGKAAPGGGNLIAFEARFTQPPTGRPVPFEPAVDRPTCLLVDSLLMTGGVAVTAELGRGQLALSNCVIATGEAAFELRPAAVRRDRFSADLRLESCTISSERDVVRLGAWPGKAPGPDRPWVVDSRNCAFFDTYDRPRRESVLIRSEPDGLTRSALHWQAEGDHYELVHYLAGEGITPPASPRSSVLTDWVDLWSPRHIRGVTGPMPGRSAVSLKLTGDRLEPGRISPGELAIDPRFGPAARTSRLGADLRRLGISPVYAPIRPTRRR